MFERKKHVISYLWIRGWEKVGVWNNVDKISDYLYLSSLPMRGNEENLIKDVGAIDSHSMLVVSVVEDYENTETLFFMDPTRPDEWKKTFTVDESEVKVDHKQVKMKDFSSGKEIDIKSAAETVIEIQQCRVNKQSVLVHCKAGRTRSAMLVACVLAVYDVGKQLDNVGKSPEQLIQLALDFMLEKRPQIKVHDDVKETAVKIINTVRKILRGVEKPDEPLKIKLDRAAINKNIKDIITEMDSYKNLLEYRDKAIDQTGQMFAKIKPVMRAGHIDKFERSVAEVNDGSWLHYLMCQTGPIKEFIDAEPYFIFVNGKDEDKKERAKLIEDLKSEVKNMLCLNLNCAIDELEEFFPIGSRQTLMQPS